MKKNDFSPSASHNWLLRLGAFLRRRLDDTYDCGLLVLLVAALTYLPGYGLNGMFWDENYHVTSAERYIEGIAQFEAHPPLGKLLIAAGEVLSRANSAIDKHVLTEAKYIKGDQLPKGFSMRGMRLMPALFAVFGAACFFGLMFALTRNRITSLLLSALYVFENAFIVHFRAAHLDSFQLCFSLGTFWYFVILWRQELRLNWQQYALLAIPVGLAMMIKINAVLLLPLFPLLYWRDSLRGSVRWPLRLIDFLQKSGAAITAVLAVFFLVFWLSALCGRQMPDPNTPAGREDIPKMSSAYQSFLLNKEALTPDVVVRIGIDYFAFMSQNHVGVPKLDVCKPEENGSHPMHWPLMDKTINYRWDSSNGMTGYVQLVGNLASWWLGLAAVILSLGLVISRRVFGAPAPDQESYQLIEVFSLLYLVFMGLHLWMGAQRVMYLYHYFLGLTLSYALLALNVIYLANARPWLAQRGKTILASLVILVFVSYAFVAPLTYHYPISKSQCELRNWLFRTVNCI